MICALFRARPGSTAVIHGQAVSIDAEKHNNTLVANRALFLNLGDDNLCVQPELSRHSRCLWHVDMFPPPKLRSLAIAFKVRSKPSSFQWTMEQRPYYAVRTNSDDQIFANYVKPSCSDCGKEVNSRNVLFHDDPIHHPRINTHLLPSVDTLRLHTSRTFVHHTFSIIFHGTLLIVTSPCKLFLTPSRTNTQWQHYKNILVHKITSWTTIAVITTVTGSSAIRRDASTILSRPNFIASSITLNSHCALYQDNLHYTAGGVLSSTPRRWLFIPAIHKIYDALFY